MLPVALRASRQPAAWPLWRSPPADWDPMFPSLDTDLKAARRQSEPEVTFTKSLSVNSVNSLKIICADLSSYHWLCHLWFCFPAVCAALFMFFFYYYY